MTRKSLVVTLFISLILTLVLQVQAKDMTISASELEENIKFREMFGLEQNIDFVKDTIKHKAIQESKELYGVSLTKEELDNLQQRRKNADEMRVLKRELIEVKYKDVFGGIYIDQINGGIFNIGIVNLNQNQEVVSEIKSNFSDESKLKFYDTEYTYNELLKQQSILDDYIFNNRLDVIYTEISVEENRVVIGIESLNAYKIERLFDMFDYKVIIKNHDSYSIVQESRVERQRPLAGGLGILWHGHSYELDKATCTGGFSAFDRSGNYFYITNHHCTSNLYERWYQGGD